MKRYAEKWDMSPARIEPDKTTYVGRFAIRLRKLREDAGLTPEEVGTALGVSPNTIYQWEAARRQPQIAQLPEIASVLGISVRTLMAQN